MGVPAFARQLDLPLQFYAPYFCTDTPYYTNFTFLKSNSSLPGCSDFDFVIPTNSYEFYKWFFTLGKAMGMTHFEMDFVDQNLNCMMEFSQQVNAAHDYLLGMSTAALELGIPVQWCFATPSAMLQSLHYPAVTNARVSWDYFYGNSWDIGLSSLLAWAVNVAPSTDTFWTSDNGDDATKLGGCDAQGCPPDHSDAGCELHTLLASMSTGPVAFSDSLYQTNAERILQTCRSDGTLLRPSKPITAMDASLGNSYHLLQTHSGSHGYYVVGHHLSRQVDIFVSDLWPRVESDSYWFAIWNHTTSRSCVTHGDPAINCGQYVTAKDALTMSKQPDNNQFKPTIIALARVCSNSDFVLVGELSKYVSLSTDRFSNIECLDSGLLFQLHGAPGELVTVTTINSGTVQVHTHKIGQEPAVIRYRYNVSNVVMDTT
jgi:hypothetical protein